MTRITSFAMLLSLMAAPALAAEYPAVETYRATAQTLFAQTQSATAANVAGLIEKTRLLVQQGGEILALYGEKNPNCGEQFEAMIVEIPSIEFMTLDDANKRYHDGRGLPTAPRHCYFGRSQVIHPALNVIRLKSGWSEAIRTATLKDLDEVIEHLARIQQNLDNPPN